MLPFPKSASPHCLKSVSLFISKMLFINVPAFPVAGRILPFTCMNLDVLPERWTKAFIHRFMVSMAPQPERRSEDYEAGLRSGMSHNPCGCVTSGAQQTQQLPARAPSKQTQRLIISSQTLHPRKRSSNELRKNVAPQVCIRGFAKAKGLSSPFYSVSQWLFFVSLPRKIPSCSFPIW